MSLPDQSSQTDCQGGPTRDLPLVRQRTRTSKHRRAGHHLVARRSAYFRPYHSRAATAWQRYVTDRASSNQTQIQGKEGPSMNQTQKPLEIGMLLYPGLTPLDLIGPHTVFSRFANIHLVWKTTDLVRTDTGIGVKPNATFATCPRELDILFVPGGFGQQNLMADSEVITFLADRGARAKFVTSVCSGSLLLGAAGLLQGYKATSHWAAREGLSAFGAEPTDARVGSIAIG